MAQNETMKAAVLDAANAPFRLAQVARPIPDPARCWSASRPAASIRSTPRSAPVRRRMRGSRCPQCSASISPAAWKRSARRHAASRGRRVYGMTGGVGGVQGSLAEYAAVDARLLAHKPAELDARGRRAATGLHHRLGRAGRSRRCQGRTDVLVHGGAGGVGHIAVQIARAFGATVFATDSAAKPRLSRTGSARPRSTIARGRRTICRAAYRRPRLRHRLRHHRRRDARRIVQRGPALRPCRQRARLGRACAGAAVVPGGDLFGRLHAAAAADR